MSTRAPTPLYEALGLTSEEYDDIRRVLDRDPDHAELAMFSVMWSEHCSYKSSRSILTELPTQAPWVLVGPGENAGVVEAGSDPAYSVRIAFKIESHNHPSAVEPFQGAATGVGGIVRDILSLGARPLALLDSLRFGPLIDHRNRYLFDGVVRGIANYGNALGLPVVGGEAVFDVTYSGNPLVNVMCVGILEDDEVLRSAAGEPGQTALLFGSRTGRDGIGGASILASKEFEEGAESKRPSVQVGDPFTEKLLIEACLEMKREGLLAGLQDLGAAGITCALSETAAAGGLGIEADLDQVMLREPGMEAWEILMSESQERMLACLPTDRVGRAVEICERWGLEATVVGRYTEGGRLVVRHQGHPVADVPASSLADGPAYDRPRSASDRSRLCAVDPFSLPWSENYKEMLVGLLAAPSIASKQWVWQQYDHMVRLNALVSPGADGAVLRLPEDPDRSHQVGVVLSTDGPGRYGTLDPWTAGALAVAESARNVACMGARPLAITNCLNFASPERPETMSDFARVVRGIGDACRAFGIPVTGGNVSFYNEAPGGWVHPTPVVGMVGVIEDAYAHRPATARSGQVLILLGETKPELGGSEVLLEFQQRIAGMPPAVDLNAEVALVRLLCNLRLPGHVHDISEGGLGVALAETCVRARCGAKVELPPDTEPLWALFGESTARAIVACEPDHAPHWLEAAAKAGIRTHVLGRMKGQSLEIDDLIDVWVAEIRQAHESTLRMTMEQ